MNYLKNNHLKCFLLLTCIAALCLFCGCGKGLKVERIEPVGVDGEEEGLVPQVLSFINSEEGWGGTVTSRYGGEVTPTRDTRKSTPLFHYYEGEWHGISFKEDISIVDVFALDENNVWAVGWEDVHGEDITKPAKEFGLVLYYDGEDWNKITWSTVSHRLAISAASPDDVYVVGMTDEYLHYNGDNWTFHKLPKDTLLYDCDVPSKGSCWAVGSIICNISNSKLKRHTTENDFSLDSISMVDNSEGWAVGTDIFHYDGKSWERYNDPGEHYSLWSVDMCSKDHGWAVGDRGTILEYDGTNWIVSEAEKDETMAIPNVKLKSVSAISETECWIAGSGEEGDIVLHIKK